MAICPNCGSFGDRKFCPNCGTPLLQDPQPQVEPQAAQQPEAGVQAADARAAQQPEADAQAAEQPAVETQSAPQAGYAPGAGFSSQPASAGGFQPDSQPAAAFQPQAGAQAAAAHDASIYTTGKSGDFLSQACKDVFKDANIIKVGALLGLLNCVPILNLVTSGYAVRWGRRAAFRLGDKLSVNVFGDKAFSTGFFVVVVALVWALIAVVLALIPILGWVVLIAAIPFMMLAPAYLGVADDIGAGLRFKRLWTVGKRNYGGLWLVGLVPSVIGAVIIGVLSSIAQTVGAVDTLTISTIGSLSGTKLALSALTSLSVPAAFASVIFVYLESVLGTLATLVTYRALGYWIGRYGAEWVQESVASGAQPN